MGRGSMKSHVRNGRTRSSFVQRFRNCDTDALRIAIYHRERIDRLGSARLSYRADQRFDQAVVLPLAVERHARCRAIRLATIASQRRDHTCR